MCSKNYVSNNRRLLFETYVPTIVIQLFCTIIEVMFTLHISTVFPFMIPKLMVRLDSCLHNKILSDSGPFPKSMIRSHALNTPVNLANATAVNPPFVAILNVWAPVSRCCENALSKVTAPLLPGGPAVLLKTAVGLYKTKL